MDFERKVLRMMLAIHVVLNVVALVLVISQLKGGLYASAMVSGVAFVVTLVAIVCGIRFLKEVP